MLQSKWNKFFVKFLSEVQLISHNEKYHKKCSRTNLITEETKLHTEERNEQLFAQDNFTNLILNTKFERKEKA